MPRVLLIGPVLTPGATVLVILVGCLLLGLILGWISARGPLDDRLRALLPIGLIGSFTTFSTYAGDALRLILEQRAMVAIAYLFGSMALGLALCTGGYALAHALARTSEGLEHFAFTPSVNASGDGEDRLASCRSPGGVKNPRRGHIAPQLHSSGWRHGGFAGAS